ncbi:TPA: hypothetical protein L5T32_004289 [Pseudomonas aeruginosa]|nr:hypothetical protein [Pseudomonas aeruginosa]
MDKDLSWHLEQAAQEADLDSIGLAHNLGEATLDQLHDIVAFAERLKEAAMVEMWGREREAKGMDSSTLELPPEGYTGYNPS